MLSVEALDVRPEIVSALRTYRDRWARPLEELLISSPKDVASTFKLENNEVKELMADLARKYVKSRDLAICLNVLKPTEGKFSTGDPGWDKFLGGGLPTKGVTEIVGPSGSGKTQLSLQVALAAQLPRDLGGLNGSVLYITIGSSFPIKRFSQLISSFSDHEKLPGRHDFFENLFVENVRDAESLCNVLTRRLPVLIAKQSLTMFPIRLLCIDSIGAVFRGDADDATGGTPRLNYISRISAELHRLSVYSNIAIVVLNQVTEKLYSTVPESHTSEGKDIDQSKDKITEISPPTIRKYTYAYERLDPNGFLSCVPCLGLFWANSITTRLSIYRDPHNSTRKAYVVFSPFIANKISEFSIDTQGVHINPTDF